MMPVVAIVHYCHQVLTNMPYIPPPPAADQSRRHYSTLTLGQLQFMAALEAPLTICENFIAWAGILFALAARNRAVRRMTAVLVVALLCFASEGMHVFIFESKTDWVNDADSRFYSLLLRPFLFHVLPAFQFLAVLKFLTVVVYIFEVIFFLSVVIRG
ncbi:hypothetical protein QBC38DRAFT_492478 [Podospora fimiseda]|uniref:EXPERA domain-containing protein n=1 Tax=Podospora fimiseda TaxID=252190 RepID=A0AAN6YR21_9PEZI|nr:hypothetical protein QBC38DRAFT_492478 [Podospora fimiseda]